MNQDILLGQIRVLLAVIGGFVVAQGYASDAAVATVIGITMAVIPLAWSAWAHFQTEKKTQARESVAVNVGIAVADRTAGVTPAVAPVNAPAVIEAFTPVVPAPTSLALTALPVLPTDPVLPPPKKK